MEPKGIIALVAGTSTGAITATGILDQPVLLMWLGFGSLAGGLVSLAAFEADSSPGEPRSLGAIFGQFLVGLSCGMFGAPIAMVEWQPDPPYRAEHVAGIAFGIAIASWQLIRLAEPILKRYGRGWLKRKLEGRIDD